MIILVELPYLKKEEDKYMNKNLTFSIYLFIFFGRGGGMVVVLPPKNLMTLPTWRIF
jgi:hypothetical protein